MLDLKLDKKHIDKEIKVTLIELMESDFDYHFENLQSNDFKFKCDECLKKYHEVFITSNKYIVCSECYSNIKEKTIDKWLEDYKYLGE